MIVCVTSTGKTLDSAVDPRFGRCGYFIIVDSDTGSFEALENAQAQFQGGAGIQSAQMVSSKGVKAVLTGNVGPNAHQSLTAAGIDIYTGAGGTVAEALAAFKTGALKKAGAPNVGSKFGMGK